MVLNNHRGRFVLASSGGRYNIASIANLVKLSLGRSTKNVIADIDRIFQDVFNALVPPRLARGARSLGRGMGDNFQPAGEVGVPELQLPDFDFPQFDPPPTSNFFGTATTNPYEMLWSNGTVPRASTAKFTLSIDGPDDIGADLYSTFTLRQITIVPEPSTLTLLGIGLTACALRLRRKSA